MAKSVLVIGSGGREHALCWKLAQSPQVGRVFAAPGSYGIGRVDKVTRAAIDIKNFKEVADFCKRNAIDLVAVGPENPLADGIADVLCAAGIACFGPKSDAARIEADKSWAKKFMDRHGIPTACWKSFTDAAEAKEYIDRADHAALVVKASGLAAGKGVVVAADRTEACAAVDEMLGSRKFGDAGDTVVVEELLEGEEVSLLAFTDGAVVVAMPPAQDHKRIGDGDRGPNTGGMGAYCPYPSIDDAWSRRVRESILERTVTGFKKDGIEYVGVLYVGLMLTADGPKVLEFNCRFGDPETQVLLPILESDLFAIMHACCCGTLSEVAVEWKSDANAVGVVMASRGYPETSSKGDIVTGVAEIEEDRDVIVFHSGTALSDGNIVTDGGRVLIVVSIAPELILAAMKATRACDRIKFDGSQYRRDIAHRGIARTLVRAGGLTYEASGVDIASGNCLVDRIKPAARSTDRSGTSGGLGGFGGAFDVRAAGYDDPILVSGTDGVGTKLKIAQKCGVHDTIGIDLVAMCANDVLAHGAEPLFFLDYFACGTLDVDVAELVVSGIAEGCRRAGCALIGGETAEMPDMYAAGEYDLAGFVVGAVERKRVIPRSSEIEPGDVVVGLPSSGVHSNGFSLVRRVVELAGVDYVDRTPFGERTFGEEFLKPTEIYVKSLLPAMKAGHVKAFAHVTGGGLSENIPRVVPDSLRVELDARKWSVPPVFGWLAALGRISVPEMLRTFNCGIGGVVISSPGSAVEVLKLVRDASIIGAVVHRSGDELPVVVKHFEESLVPLMLPHVPAATAASAETKKRVGVLISGSGTNLQSLIDSTSNPVKRIGAEIVLVISNRPDVDGLRRARDANVPTEVVEHSDYPNRVEFDRALDGRLVDANVDIVCLAGFMRILSGEFVRKWRGRLLNVHPSLLPSFKGVRAQKQALDAGVKITGCTVHFVEEDIDSGAIIVQKSVPVLPGDTEDVLTERIKRSEHEAFPEALRLVSTREVYLDAGGALRSSR